MKYWILLACFLASSASISADDGSWSSDRGFVPAEGALYSEAGQTPIALEKEYLELSEVVSGRTRAVFQFHNTSNQPLTVECAFPIRITFSLSQPYVFDAQGKIVPETSRDGNGKLTNAGQFEAFDFGPAPGKYGKGALDSDAVAGWFKILGIPFAAWNPEEAGLTDPDVWDLAGNLARLDQYPKGRKEYPAQDLLSQFGLSMDQDGTPVAFSSCVADFGSQPGTIVLHFRHQLKFAAGQVSRLTVAYALETLSGQASGGAVRYSPTYTTYNWNYILETASSWKGPLGDIVLAVPPGFGTLPDPWKLLGTRGGRLLYRATNWKPGPKQNLSLHWGKTTRDFDGLWADPDMAQSDPPTPPKDDTVKYVAASSELGEKADVFLEAETWKQAPFTADRLFDGLRETAWAVRTKKGGIGESVTFQLKKPVLVAVVQNGYRRALADFPPKVNESFYAKNNRVKTLEIRHDGGGKLTQLNLADDRELQYLNLQLPPGIYQAIITEIYPGTQWNDTCLGELAFLPGVDAGLARLAADEFFGPLLR
jgi:hypothetical protein